MSVPIGPMYIHMVVTNTAVCIVGIDVLSMSNTPLAYKGFS